MCNYIAYNLLDAEPGTDTIQVIKPLCQDSRYSWNCENIAGKLYDYLNGITLAMPEAIKDMPSTVVTTLSNITTSLAANTTVVLDNMVSFANETISNNGTLKGSSQEKNNGLSDYAITGIVLGCFGMVLLSSAAVVFACHHYKKSSYSSVSQLAPDDLNDTEMKEINKKIEPDSKLTTVQIDKLVQDNKHLE